MNDQQELLEQLKDMDRCITSAIDGLIRNDQATPGRAVSVKTFMLRATYREDIPLLTQLLSSRATILESIVSLSLPEVGRAAKNEPRCHYERTKVDDDEWMHICVVHGFASKYPPSVGENRPCLKVDPVSAGSFGTPFRRTHERGTKQ